MHENVKNWTHLTRAVAKDVEGPEAWIIMALCAYLGSPRAFFVFAGMFRTEWKSI
jgi:hypothetical protein